jgi:hypothetical protein
MTKKVQYCVCKINLAGQNCHTVIYTEHNPLTWPEIQVLQMLHGDENVMDIMPVGIGEVWPTNEKNRLVLLYGHRVVEACFPGRAFRMEYMMTDDENLPFYEDGVLAAPEITRRDWPSRTVDIAQAAAGSPAPEPKPKPAPAPPPAKPPEPTIPGEDHDDGEDDDAPSAAAMSLEPIFKPGRARRPEPRKGA